MQRDRLFHRPPAVGSRLLALLALLAGLLAGGASPGLAQQAPHRIALPLVQTRPDVAVGNQYVTYQTNYLWVGMQYGYAEVRNLTDQPLYDVTVEMTFYTSTIELGRAVTGTVPLYGVLPGDTAMVMVFSGFGAYEWETTLVETKILGWNTEREAPAPETLAPLAVRVTDFRYVWHLYDVDVEVTNTGALPAKEWRISMHDGYGVRTYAYDQPLAPGERRTVTLSSSHFDPPGLEAQGLADQP
ncbi:MAG TPA: hypothetical protein VGE07_13590 [Herpetosiphonaceae bacterium]